jgi:hypothetical protein
MTTKAELHSLVDLLPDQELPAVQWFLDYVYTHSNPVLRTLSNAPLDDEDTSAEEELLVQEARAEVARGEVSTWEEAKQRLLRNTL